MVPGMKVMGFMLNFPRHQMVSLLDREDGLFECQEVVEGWSLPVSAGLGSSAVL
jgi:hypothetical protein